MKIRVINAFALTYMASILILLISCEDWSKRPIIGTLSYDNLYTTEGTPGSVSPNWSSTAPSTQTMEYSISPSIAGVSIDSDNGIVTVSSTAAIMNMNFAINAEAIGNYKGSKQASTTVIVAEATINNIANSTLSYGSTSLTALHGVAKSYSASTTIPTAAKATYTLSARGITSAVPSGITIGTTTPSTITIGNDVAVGTYQLTVTATPTAGGYTGTKTADISIQY